MPRHIEHVFPRDDIDFVALVDRLALSTGSPAELQRRLKTRYPRVLVRARELSGENFEVWYVYRDGSWKETPSE